MQFRNLDEAIDFAIEKEREAAEFYRRISEQESLNNKEMFLEFCREEEKHEELLKQLKSGKTTGELDNYKWKWIIDIKRSNYAEKIEYKAGMTYREILMLASKREEQALAMYNQFLKGAENDHEKKLFKMLCQEEARHKLAIEGMLDDFMAEMGD